MVNQIGMNSYGYYNYRNNLATRPVAFKGQEAITHEVKNSLTAENDKKNANSAATLMLGGGILATLSAAALYVLTRGKGSKAATEVAEKAATKATNSVKIDPEVKFIETIEKKLPKFKEGQELALQNGGKRIDKFKDGGNISEYYDKSGKLTKQVSYIDDGFVQFDRFDKNGKLKSTIMPTGKSSLIHKKFDKEGRIESIINGENRTDFSYSNYNNGDVVIHEIQYTAESRKSSIPWAKTVNTTKNKNGAITFRQTHYPLKTNQFEWFNKDENCLYMSEIRDVSKLPAGVLKSKTTHTIVRDSGGYPEKVLIEETGKAPREVDYEEYIDSANMFKFV